MGITRVAFELGRVALGVAVACLAGALLTEGTQLSRTLFAGVPLFGCVGLLLLAASGKAE